MKKKLTLIFLIISNFFSYAQICGNDNRLGNNPSYTLINGASLYSNSSGNGKGFMCNRANFDGPMSLNSYADPYASDWQNIFRDDFNAVNLDENYWKLMLPWGNDNSGGGGMANAVVMPNLNTLQNGKLIQKGLFAPGTYNIIGSSPKYALTQVPAISTHFEIPINCRVRASVKIMNDCQNNWPALWLFGDQGIEIDIFEFTNDPLNQYDDNYPENYQKMTYHQSQYGYGPPTDAIGVQYGMPYYSQNFHTFEIIWDQFKIQWWLDGNIIYADYVYFKTNKHWSNNKLNHHWRESPVKKPSDLDIGNSHVKYMVNKYAIDNLLNCMNLILSFSAPGANSDYTQNQMETDWVSFSLRANCNSGVNYVNALQWYDYNTWTGTAYETGYQISTDPNTIISVPINKTVFFAASDEIALNPGVSIDGGAVFSAELTSCETGWDARTYSGTEYTEPSEGDSAFSDSTEARMSNVNPDEFTINDEDSIIYFNTLSEFDETNPFTELVNYPDHITLTSNNEQIKSTEIYNMRGELIYRNPAINSQYISINKDPYWASGLYIIRVYSSSTIHIHRVWIRGN